MNKIQWLNVKGKYIEDQEGNAKILRGVSIADPKSLMFYKRDRPYDLFKIMEMAVNEWHANVIRLPIHPGGIDDIPGWGENIDEYMKDYLIPAVSKAIDLNTYVIIDLH